MEMAEGLAVLLSRSVQTKSPAERAYNRLAHTRPGGESTVTDVARPELTPEVLSATVWDAIKEVPGVEDLYRNPLQSLGERVGIERHGPVRLLDQQPPVLEVHLVVAAGRPILPVAEAVHRTLDRHLSSLVGMREVSVHVVIDDIAEAPGGE